MDNTPDAEVFMALRASIAIPILFEPVLYKGNLYIDGCIFENIPHLEEDVKRYAVYAIIQKKEKDEKLESLTFATYLYCLGRIFLKRILGQGVEISGAGLIVNIDIGDLLTFNFTTCSFSGTSKDVKLAIDVGYNSF